MIGFRTFVKTVWLVFLLVCCGGVVTRASCTNSIARVWDEEILSAIRIDTPNPPVQARNLFHLSVAMYDAWAAYDNVAVGYLYRGKHTAADVAAARWQPLAITNAVDQNGFPAGPIQSFLGAQWLGVRPFALARSETNLPWIDPGPQPHFHGAGHTQFTNEVVDVIRHSSELTPDDGVTINISPGAWGNNSLGLNDGTGHPLNPVTSQPYTNNIVKRGDFARVLAEFWADGPSSETPPGHWNVLANGV